MPVCEAGILGALYCHWTAMNLANVRGEGWRAVELPSNFRIREVTW
jgi:hypothetical protein